MPKKIFKEEKPAKFGLINQKALTSQNSIIKSEESSKTHQEMDESKSKGKELNHKKRANVRLMVIDFDEKSLNMIVKDNISSICKKLDRYNKSGYRIIGFYRDKTLNLVERIQNNLNFRLEKFSLDDSPNIHPKADFIYDKMSAFINPRTNPSVSVFDSDYYFIGNIINASNLMEFKFKFGKIMTIAEFFEEETKNLKELSIDILTSEAKDSFCEKEIRFNLGLAATNIDKPNLGLIERSRTPILTHIQSMKEINETCCKLIEERMKFIENLEDIFTSDNKLFHSLTKRKSSQEDANDNLKKRKKNDIEKKIFENPYINELIQQMNIEDNYIQINQIYDTKHIMPLIENFKSSFILTSNEDIGPIMKKIKVSKVNYKVILVISLPILFIFFY